MSKLDLSFINPNAKSTKWTKSGYPYNSKVPVFNRKMQIVIPTHKRSTRQHTLRYLPEFLQQQVLLVTSFEKDAEEIREHYSELITEDQVISIEAVDPRNFPKVNNIGKKRQWIVENVGAHAIFQMDDDFQGFYKRCPKKYRFLDDGPSWVLTEQAKAKGLKLLGLGNITDQDVIDIFEKLQIMLSDPAGARFYAHAGLSSRMGNNRVPETWVIGGRMMHAIGHHRGTLFDNGIKFDEVQMREDFNVTLRLLRAGYPNAIYYDICVSPDDYGKAGGCTEERPLEYNNEQAELLAKTHPGLVRVKQKEYTHSQPRKEVVISWQKALKEGMEARAAREKGSLFSGSVKGKGRK